MKTYTLLAVDDRPENLLLLRELVARHIPECELITAGSAAEGLSLAAERPPDGVLIDLRMPQMDGMEMCRRLKAGQATRHLPVILITANGSTAELTARGLEAGAADDFITRPVDNVELVARIGSLMRVKLVRTALQESENKFRELAEQSPNMIFIVTKERITYVNGASQQIMGYSKEEFCAPDFDFRALIAPESVDLANANFSKHIKGEEVPPAEYSLITKQGKRIQTLQTTKLIDYEGGKAILVVSTDITQRKREQEELGESESNFRAIFENVGGAMFIADVATGKILDCNRQAEQLLGRSRAELIGMHQSQLHPKGEEEQYRQKFATHAEKGRIVDFEGEVQHADGRRIPVVIATQKMKTRDRESLVGLFLDITEHKRAEDELRQFKTIVDRASYGAAIVDLDGNFLYVNEAFARMHQYAPEELAGKHLAVFHNQEQLPRVTQLNQWLLSEGAYSAEEVWHARKDGSVFPTLMNATVIKDEGRALYLSATAIDITQHKRLEEEFRLTHKKLRTVFDAIQGAITVFDLDFNLTDVNAAQLEAFDLPEKESVVGRKCFEVFKGRKEPCPHCAVAEVYRTRSPAYRASTIQDIALSKGRIFEIFASPIMDEQGNLTGVIEFARDITEQKRAEQALRESEEKFRTLVENLGAGVSIVDKNQQFVFANPAAERIFGVQSGGLVGRNLAEFIAPHASAIVQHHVDKRHRGETSTYDLELIRPNGKKRQVVITGSPRFSDDRKYTGAIASFFDVTRRKQVQEELKRAHQELERRVKRRTAELAAANVRLEEEAAERKRSEKALRDSEQRYRSLFEQAADAIVLIDVESGALVDFNDRACENLGYTRQEFQQLTIPDFEVIESAEEVARHIENIRREGGDTFETKQRTKTGEIRDVLVSCRCVSFGGRDFVQAIWRDITQSKQAADREKTLQADLAHMGRLTTMGEMASGLAHELNQPLAAISMFAQLAANRVRSGEYGDGQELVKVCEDIAGQAFRAGELIRRMRQLVKKIVPRRTTLKLTEVLDEVLPLVESGFRNARIAINIDVDESLPTTLGDKVQVEQVLLNLMRNALEAMQRVEFDAHQLDIEARVRDGSLVIAVRDTGDGISQHRIGEMFGAFYSTKPEGMGMGLAISRSIVEAHGGKLWAAPNPDRGATFTFTLPIAGGDGENQRRESKPSRS